MTLFTIGVTLPLASGPVLSRIAFESRLQGEIRVIGNGIDVCARIPTDGQLISEFLDRFAMPTSTTTIQLIPSENYYGTIAISNLNAESLRNNPWADRKIMPGDTIWLLNGSGTPY